MITSKELQTKLRELEARRKSEQLDKLSFYRELVKLLYSLHDVLLEEELTEKELNRLIPTLLVFLEEQILELQMLEQRKQPA